jgi:hypothetical protein
MNIKFKNNLAMLERYGQVTVIAWGFSFNSFMPSFLFFFLFFFFFLFLFTNYLKNEISFVNKITRYRQYPSHQLIPIIYGVIVAAPPGDGTCPVKCQESWFLFF